MGNDSQGRGESERSQLLRNAPLLATVPQSEIEHLCSLLRTVEVKAAGTLARVGQPSPGMVLVEQGSLEVLLDSIPVCTLSPGSVYSEDSLLSEAPAPATLRAALASRVLVLEREAVEEQIDRMPRLAEVLDRAWRHRILAARLYAIDLFREVGAEARLRLADAFEEIELPAGSLLAEEGKVLDALFVIRGGQAELHLRDGEPATVPLRSGEYVGDLALLEDFPQTARVSAPDGLRAMRLDRRAFAGALDDAALREVRAAVARRKDSIL